MGPKAPSLLKSNRRKHFWVSTGRRAPQKVPQSHTKFTKQHMQINNSQYFSPQESENGQTAKKPSLLWYEKITALNQHQINPHTKTITRDIWTRETKAIRQQQSLPQKLLVHQGYFGLSLWLKPTKKKYAYGTWSSESFIALWITHDSTNWLEQWHAHTSALSNFFQDTQKTQSQQPFKIRKYRPIEEVRILFVSGLPPKAALTQI